MLVFYQPQRQLDEDGLENMVIRCGGGSSNSSRHSSITPAAFLVCQQWSISKTICCDNLVDILNNEIEITLLFFKNTNHLK